MKRPEHSLRKRLLTRLWIPLASVLLLGAMLSFGLSYHFGNVVHDRWLLDSATTLATQLRADTGKLILICLNRRLKCSNGTASMNLRRGYFAGR